MDAKPNKLDDEQSSDEEFEQASEEDADSIAEFNLDALSRRIDNYFKIFDQHGNSTIESNELGNLIRCLRINCKQRLVKDIESQLVKQENRSISIEHLKPRLISCMQEDTLKPPSEKKLEMAFKTIEEGYEPLTKDRLEKCLMTQGEYFTQNEWNEMLNHLVIKKNGVVDFKAYIRDIMYIINKKA